MDFAAVTYLEEDQIRRSQLPTVQPGTITAGLALQDPLKVAQKLGQAVGDIVLALLQTLLLLVLIVQTRRDWVMTVMRLVAQAIQCGKRQLVDNIYAILIGITGFRREAQLGAQVQEDVWGLVDDQVAVPEDGRCEDRGVELVVACVLGVDEGQDLVDAVLDMCCVGVGGTGFLEGETDVLASSGESGPVDEVVGVVLVGLLALGGRSGGRHGEYAGLKSLLSID